MRLFVSAGEPSGDLHGANLIHFLRRRQPDLEVHGFGGDRMVEAGAQLLYPLADHAYVGLIRVLGSVPEHAALAETGREIVPRPAPRRAGDDRLSRLSLVAGEARRRASAFR